ncbi:hypothetical protein ACQJBY_026700 [Aegilops geniculata]
MDWDILPRRAAWWPRCGSPMLCSDGPPLLDGCRWTLVEFGTVSCCRLRRASGPSLLLIEAIPHVATFSHRIERKMEEIAGGMVFPA